MPGREETPLDQEVFDTTLAAELAKGTDRRVAEGRARSAAVRAYRKVHGEPEREARPAEERAHVAAATAAAPSGDGGGDGGGAAVAVPVAAAVAYAPPPAAAIRTAPPPTGRAPSPKAAAPGNH